MPVGRRRERPCRPVEARQLFVIDVRRRIASSAGLVQSHFSRHARLSFARVAEYQKRAVVHVHAVVRLDGPNGSDGEPPVWGTPDVLLDAVHASARRVLVRTPNSSAVGELILQWGAQVDARPIRVGLGEPDDDAVAAYVAKYVTKGAGETGAGVDHALSTWGEVESAPVSEHVRTLMRACWGLGNQPEYAHLRLRDWTHTLGYRGHILTKSRAYSTTYAALRAERAGHVGHADLPGVVTERQWCYIGAGHGPGAALIAMGIADDLTESRRLGLEARRAGEQGR
ncbi:replication initiator [Streptomyces sp. NPDC002935]|uniref:replication initiator n=1 Tax=Streptomyces sp. NPDC002935 TaxID=3154545 RepID=UPI0033BA4DC0